ncbi:sensor histidine kinase [Paenibacillus sp. LHD-117]|uniref:cache domain-containing sensor histidine kinase n=1 Tax=Paenibacillus sp. LHD-117 TaxID=3071412 RepID=UPI0027DFC393|nr:sensor histidine kinase [Paenibacillus sp. LHD-117]MDQ6421861.1 sensor histidine kinase [Paenibacillus sp. LHD-117]
MTLLRKLTIRSQLFIIALSIAFVVLFILLSSYWQMSKIIGSNNEKYTSDLILQMKQTIHSNKDVLERLMMNIAFNSDVQSFLIEQDKVQTFMLSKRIDSLLINSRTLKEGILDIVIHGENGRWIDISGGRGPTKLYQGALGEDESFHYYGLQRFAGQYDPENVFLIGAKIKYSQPGAKFNDTIGTLFFVVSPEALLGEISELSSEMNTTSFFVDWQKRVVSGSGALENGVELDALSDERSGSVKREIKWNGKTYVAHTEYLSEIKSSIVSMIPKEALMRDMNAVRLFFIAVFLFGSVVLLVLFGIIAGNILLPLKKLMMFMNMLKRGDLGKLKSRIDLDGYVEISLMANEFNHMLNQIDALTRELLNTNAALYGAELEKKKSELAYLRSQINPHFLYNTLEMIKGMAAVKGAQEIREAASSLGRIFRYSIKGEGIVPLHTELSIVESYLQIQRMRFGSRFIFTFDIDGNALQCQVPKMILQPIVENAVYHGLEPKEQHGILKIKAYLDERNDLIVVVEDDGVGMEPERLAALRNALSDEQYKRQLDGEGGGSIGFSNVNARIKLTCGSDYGLEVVSAENAGTRVRVKLPTKGEVPNAI